jgi:hypothetical protein
VPLGRRGRTNAAAGVGPWPRALRWAPWGAASAVAAAAASFGVLRAPSRPAGTGVTGSARAIDSHTLAVPRASGVITIDGDTDDPGWGGPPEPARTGPFALSNGAPASPYSEARLVWEGPYLFLALYAADEDIRSRGCPGADASPGDDCAIDSFRLTLSRGELQYVIEVSPRGIEDESIRSAHDASPRAWASGAHVASERDGTPDDPSDTDEEWRVEMAIPLDAFGVRAEPGEALGLRLRRCDRPKNAATECAQWGAGDVPGQIVLQ